MLDGMFIEDDYNDNQTSNSNQKNIKNPNLNCASYINKPDAQTGESGFVGLYNQ
jgi:hypothetical protein